MTWGKNPFTLDFSAAPLFGSQSINNTEKHGFLRKRKSSSWYASEFHHSFYLNLLQLFYIVLFEGIGGVVSWDSLSLSWPFYIWMGETYYTKFCSFPTYETFEFCGIWCCFVIPFIMAPIKREMWSLVKSNSVLRSWMIKDYSHCIRWTVHLFSFRPRTITTQFASQPTQM